MNNGTQAMISKTAKMLAVESKNRPKTFTHEPM
jgi:hypothetical protein